MNGKDRLKYDRAIARAQEALILAINLAQADVKLQMDEEFPDTIYPQRIYQMPLKWAFTRGKWIRDLELALKFVNNVVYAFQGPSK